MIPTARLANRVHEAGGYAKSATPFAEFLWADFLRARIGAGPPRRGSPLAVRTGVKLARSTAARYLAGLVRARVLKQRWPDLLAGVAISGLVVPEALAYSGIAGLPPLSGLLGALAGLSCYALLGTSRYAIVSSTSSSAAVLAAALPSMAALPGAQALALAAALVIASGPLFIACSALRLGRLAQFIARPVVRGFSLGIAAVITVRQLAKLCGLHAAHSAFGPPLFELFQRRAQWQSASLLLGLAALVLLLLLQRWPRFPARCSCWCWASPAFRCSARTPPASRWSATSI